MTIQGYQRPGNIAVRTTAGNPVNPPPTGPATAASYARFSSDQQDSSSIDQQRRRCRERAAADAHHLPPDLEFADEAVSGTRSDREGFHAMLTAARGGRFQVLYIESLSRLARELVLSIATLKELVYVHRVRVISTSEGVDSSTPGWELMAIFRSWMHGEFLAALRSAVVRGQEDAVRNDLSVGDWPLGYRSEPVAAAAGVRYAKPRRRVVIDADHAEVVRGIFRRFVVDRVPLARLAKELTRAGAPKDHRATTTAWGHGTVVGLLRNRKYIGIWPWGTRRNVRHPLTGKIRQELRPPEETAPFERERPQLRLVDDDLFFRAQGLLDENETRLKAALKSNGQLRGSTRDSQHPRHLLQSLIRCAACGSTFQVAGSRGLYLGCRGYAAGACDVKTRLPRALTSRRLLDIVGERILRDDEWRAAVTAATTAAWEDRRRGRPDEARVLAGKLSAVEARLAQLLDAIETGGDDPDVRARIAARRSERADLKRALAGVQTADEDRSARPSPAWVAAQLERLGDVLAGTGPAAAVALRNLVGPVAVAEVAAAGQKRKHFRATFVIRAAGVGSDPLRGPDVGPVVVDLVPPPPWQAHAGAVKALFDADVRFREIAERLGIPRSWVAKAFAAWHRSRGLEPPDGRAAMGRLRPPAQAERLAERAKALWDRNLLIDQIAAELGCCRATASAAIRTWFEARGQVVPDGRTRRKNLPVKGCRRSGSASAPADPGK